MNKMGYGVEFITLFGIKVPIDKIKNIIVDNSNNVHVWESYNQYVILGEKKYEIFQEIDDQVESSDSHVFICIYKICVTSYEYVREYKPLIELNDDSNILKKLLLEYDIITEEEFNENFGIYNLIKCL